MPNGFPDKLNARAGGGGVAGLTTANAGTAIGDNQIIRGDGTTGIQGSVVTLSDTGKMVLSTSGNLNPASTDILDFRDNTDTVVFVRINSSSSAPKVSFDPTMQVTSGADAFGTQDIGIVRHAAGVWKITDSTTGIKGFLGGGTAVASAAALPLPTGRVFHVTGTTNITSITSTNFQSGAVITLIFDGVLTFTDGNNLKIAGNFVTTADDTITLVYDGTSWFELCRSVN